MIDHVTIFVQDLNRSKAFYESALVPFGYRLSFGQEDVFWAFDIGNGSLFEIAQAARDVPVTPIHIAFRAEDHDQVKAFYSAALEAGAKDNGEPGPRPYDTKNYRSALRQIYTRRRRKSERRVHETYTSER